MAAAKFSPEMSQLSASGEGPDIRSFAVPNELLEIIFDHVDGRSLIRFHCLQFWVVVSWGWSWNGLRILGSIGLWVSGSGQARVGLRLLKSRLILWRHLWLRPNRQCLLHKKIFTGNVSTVGTRLSLLRRRSQRSTFELRGLWKSDPGFCLL